MIYLLSMLVLIYAICYLFDIDKYYDKSAYLFSDYRLPRADLKYGEEFFLLRTVGYHELLNSLRPGDLFLGLF